MDENRVSGTTVRGPKEGGGEREEKYSMSDQINKDELGKASCVCREQEMPT